MRLDIVNVQYHPNRDSVAALLQHELGVQFYLNLSQADLEARARDEKRPTWQDADVLAQAQHVLDTATEPALVKFQGHTITYPVAV